MPEPVQVAFRCYGSDWGMRGHGSRQVDWLVDGTLLHRENVLFVIDQAISAEYKKALEAIYRVHDTSWQVNKWEKFLRVWAPKHWVSYNDFHSRHKERNRLLREAGCQTWHYSHSVNLPHVYGQPHYAGWHHLDYDHLVCWSEVDAAAFTGGQKHILGPLFSSQVPQFVMAVFDSTWENYQPGTQEKFFYDLHQLLECYPTLMMLYKPKLAPPPLPIRKNFYTLPAWIEPGLVIGCADLTIGLAYTSPVVEARGAGREAEWYDPLRQSIEDLHQMVARRLKQTQPDPAQRFRELLVK